MWYTTIVTDCKTGGESWNSSFFDAMDLERLAGASAEGIGL